MGRNTSYPNREECASARAKIRARYEMSDRARSLRSAQNKRAYSKRQANNGVQPPIRRVKETFVFPRLPGVSAEIRSLGTKPLPIRSPAFMAYSRSINRDDHQEFALYQNGPPFIITSSMRRDGIAKLVDSLHGYKTRLHRENDTHAIAHLRRASVPVFAQELRSKIVSKLDDWKVVSNWIQAFKRDVGENVDVDDVQSHLDYCLNLILAEHHQQWIARHLVAFLEDWHALKRSKDDYIFVFSERWSKGY